MSSLFLWSKLLKLGLIRSRVNQPVFVKASTLMLNVTYKPQPSEKTVLRAKEGGNVTAQVTIKANPDPNSVKWTLHYAKDPVTNKTKPNLVLADKGTNYQAWSLAQSSSFHFSQQMFGFFVEKPNTLSLQK